MAIFQRAFNQAKILFSNQTKILKWSRTPMTSKNIGDALNPYIFEKVFGKKPINLNDTLNFGIMPVYAFIGSILDNNRVKNLTIMGAGFKSETSKMPALPVEVVAIRGPLSRKRILSMGLNCPEIYGDPAILLPKFYNPEIKKAFKVGVIPHYVDKNNPSIKSLTSLEGVKEIDVFLKFKEFVNEIKSCDFTISSSLHGIILSHAYGIPSVWIKVSDEVLGGNFKFYDYFSSFNMKEEPLNLDNGISLKELDLKKTLPEKKQMLEMQTNLYQSFKNFKF